MTTLNPIEKLIRAEQWLLARKEIEAALKAKPDSHWLHSRLALTFYEMREYSTALKHSERARNIEPNCPLVLWDLAGALQMLERPKEALEIYRVLIRKGPKRIANGPCGEGLARARGLVADCHYRSSQSLEALGRKDEAAIEFETHLDLRGPGCQSIYLLAELNHPGKDRKNRRRTGK